MEKPAATINGKSLVIRQTCLYCSPVSETKQRILETAGQLFAERGYEMVGINELIEKSGVAKATFYQHFRSKEKLCVEWLKHEAAESEQSARALLDSPLPPAEKVALKFDRTGDYLRSSEFRGCVFSNTATVVTRDTEARQVVTDYKAGARLFWQALALQLRHDPSVARALGDALFLLFSGAITEAQNSKALWPVESAKAAALILCAPAPAL
ncbi:MAG: TetR family transcriptional regulator [Verrucomicrobiaceae bacterium]|nr:TetR family transcriptional regulator [Verrucomicrobiaceae bacterium]